MLMVYFITQLLMSPDMGTVFYTVAVLSVERKVTSSFFTSCSS